MDILTTLGKALITGALAVGAMFGVGVAQAPVVDTPAVNAPAYGDFNPTGGTTYRLASSIGTTDTSIRLSSFKEPVSNIPYTMSYLGTTIGYGTLDPQNSRSEFISFTGITQNSNGTAILTGVIRGLARSPGASATGCTVASSTLRQSHSGQSIFIMSDSPCFFSEYAVKQNDEHITGQWTFDVFPITPASPAASETTAGISELATGAEAAASTASGGTGFRLTLPASLATSTYNAATAANVVPVTNSLGHIDAGFVSSSTIFSTTGFTDLQATSSVYVGDFPAYQIGKNVQVFTSTGTSTFAVPSGITKLSVEVQAAGGGGANSANTDGAGGGGGYSTEIVDVTGTSSIQVFVGSGGTSGSPGTAGGWSTFGTNGFYLSATGGALGNSSASSAGGCGTGGDINICGTGGGYGITDSDIGTYNGACLGGSSHMGGGGADQQSGGNYGGGGCGPGNGAQGIVIVRW